MNKQKLDNIILDQATEWFVLMRADEISDERSSAFAQWISQSEAHQAAYLEIGGLWDDLSILEAAPTAATSIISLADHKARKSAPQQKRHVNIPRQWTPAMIAASVAFLVISFIGYRYSDILFMDSYSTQVGGLADIILDDGSHLELNTNSEVRVDLQDDRRIVYLKRGEVFFDVAKDKTRPFYVETSGGLVRVLGTKFNIRQKGSYSDVTVLEGAVGVMDHGKINNLARNMDATLAPNQKFTLGNDQVENVAVPVNSQAVLSWRDRKLVYNGEKFSTLVEDINRYYDVEIRIGDPSLNNIEVVAILKIEDRATTLRALETTFNISARPVSKDLIYLYPNK